MTLPWQPQEKTPQTSGSIAAALRSGGWLPVLALAGCASQGPLRPPSLHLPSPVRSLWADRVGDAVDLRWTAPTRTTDGLPLSGKHFPLPLRVEICREEVTTPGCLSVGHPPATSAQPGSFHDALPPDLVSGPPHLLRYRVRMLNADGKGAAAITVETLGGEAPATLQKVEAVPVEDGVLIRWQPGPGPADGRILLRVQRGDATPDGHALPDSERKTNGNALLAVESGKQDPAGTLDPGAKPGVAQHYSIARERTVRVGGKDLTMRGQPVLLSVAADAKLPPPLPPTGLEAIVSTLGKPEIDLVWQPVSGATGYRVFRAEGTGTPALLTMEPVRGLTYSDTAVRLGARYRYRVSSVGRDGTAGEWSAEFLEKLPEP